MIITEDMMQTIQHLKFIRLMIIMLCLGLTSCSFQLQRQLILAPPLQHLYLQLDDPYSDFARNLSQNLKAAHATLLATPTQKCIILNILHNIQTQELLGMNGTQQLSQYEIKTIIRFALKNQMGTLLFGPENMQETRMITAQANQISANSNEINLFYKQMYKTLTLRLLNRLASKEIESAIIKKIQALNH